MDHGSIGSIISALQVTARSLSEYESGIARYKLPSRVQHPDLMLKTLKILSAFGILTAILNSCIFYAEPRR